MKILIVDDDATRYRELIETTAELGVSREFIDVVGCASEAEKKLENQKYDLLILDLLIPYFPEDEPSEIRSEDLLNALNESGLYEKPSKIIGITADKGSLAETVNQFEEQTWQVVQYDRENKGWLNRISNCIAYLATGEEEKSDSVFNCDLLVFCALDEPELSEVLKLDWNWEEPRPIDDTVFIYEGSIQLEGGDVISVCAAHAGRMGMVATATRTFNLINKLRPKVAVMTGICAGVEGKVNFGDVIFAECAWDYQAGKLTHDSQGAKFLCAPQQISASNEIRSKVELLKTNKTFMNSIHINYSEHINANPRLLLGPVATGAGVVADSNYVKSIVEQQRKVLGVEMEIYGFYYAAEHSCSPKPKYFSLKSVCDFANKEKSDDLQRYCSYMSAGVLKELVLRHIKDIV
jgi:nucleoside phosphorylase/CheY-like chemotaxis protein